MVLETSVSFIHLTLLIALEDLLNPVATKASDHIPELLLPSLLDICGVETETVDPKLHNFNFQRLVLAFYLVIVSSSRLFRSLRISVIYIILCIHCNSVLPNYTLYLNLISKISNATEPFLSEEIDIHSASHNISRLTVFT
jgi:hypothetical protein